MDRRNNNAFVNQLMVYTLVMIGFTGSIGLGTVWLRNQMAVTANSIRSLEARSAEIERHLAETNTQIAAEQSPDVLTRRNAEWHLGLVQPAQPQVVRINERPEERLAAKRNSELFAVEPSVKPVKFVLGGTR